MNEFDLIRRYFSTPALRGRRADVVIGIGDDCALLAPPAGQALAVSVDTLVEGVHFFPDVSPEALGHKALAVNLSDLAAMGAEPAWFTLALTLPEDDPAWLAGFSSGLSMLAQTHGIALVGGDTTRGPRSITIQVMGHVPAGQALQRDGARVGDDIYVSGVIGRAALGLAVRRAARPGIVLVTDGGQGSADVALSPDVEDAIDALERPCPRVALGLALRGVATACVDVSDGLLQDLGHVLAGSQVGARLNVEAIPVPAWTPAYQALGIATPAQWIDLCLRGGDDYELCFTAPISARDRLAALGRDLSVSLTRIGTVMAEGGLRDDKTDLAINVTGYQHF